MQLKVHADVLNESRKNFVFVGVIPPWFWGYRVLRFGKCEIQFRIIFILFFVQSMLL